MPKIHSTAIIDPTVELADDVSVGAFCIIRGRVKIGAGTIIQDRTHIQGDTTIGKGCNFGPLAMVGGDPQHSRYKGEPTRLIIGDGVIIREMASIHRAYLSGPEDATRVGDRCFIMSYAHVGHDSRVGNDVVISSSVLLAGHCTVGDRVFVGGGAGVHQFCRIGRLAVIAGNESISRDIPPFSATRYGGLKAYNAIGCRRAGMSQQAIHAIRAAYHCIHHHRSVSDVVAAIREGVQQTPEVLELLEFLTHTKRGIHPSVHFRRQTEDVNA